MIIGSDRASWHPLHSQRPESNHVNPRDRSRNAFAGATRVNFPRWKQPTPPGPAPVLQIAANHCLPWAQQKDEITHEKHQLRRCSNPMFG